jgi:hypothetical protein
MPEAFPSRSPADLSRTVAADLEGIFAGFQGASPRSGAPSPARRLAPRRAGALRLPMIGGVAAAALAGVAVGSMLGERASPPAPSLAAGPAPNVIQPSPRPAAPLSPAPPVQLAAAPKPAPVEAEPEVKKPVVKASAVKRKPKSPPRATRRHASRSEVLAADRRLRRAYASAIRAGVPRPVLVSYRNRWDRLRRSAWDEPARLVRGYGALTRDLSAEAARQS